MKRCFLILLMIILACSFQNGYAQLGRLLKNRATNIIANEGLKKVKNIASEKLQAARANFDSTSFSYAISLNDNSAIYDIHEKGELFLKVYSNLGKDDEEKDKSERARDLLDKGQGLYAGGYYAMAEVVLRTAQAVYEKNGLTSDINYPKVLSGLGLLYSTMSRFTTAEEYTRKALDIHRSAGKDNLGYGASLNNQAVLYKETGRYNQAEKNIIEASGILKDVAGSESMPYAIALNNQAMLYQSMGRYAQAEEVLKKALEISAGNQNVRSGNHQKFLTNMALLQQEMGRLQEAEKTFKYLIYLKENRFGKRHPDYAHMLENLASLYMQMEKYDQVERLLREAMDIYERKFGRAHNLYAAAIHDLGNYYRFTGKYNSSAPLLESAVEIMSQVLGEKHPQYVMAKESLATLYWKMEKWDKAEKLFEESLDQSLSFINQYFPPMSEVEKTKYWDKLRPSFERFYVFASEAPEKARLMRKVYKYHIATKGLLLRATGKIRRKILNSGNAELKGRYLEWLDQKEKLAVLYTYTREDLEQQNINVDSLEKVANATEKWLSEQSNAFSEGYQQDIKEYDNIKSALSVDEVALEFIRFRAYDQTFTDQAYYLVLAIDPQREHPGSVLVKNGVALEGRYFKYYKNAIRQKVQDQYSFAQYWAPLEPLIKDKKKIYLSPDGIYTQINLNTLKGTSGDYLLNSYTLSYISSTGDLVSANEDILSPKTATLIGAPSYSEGSGLSLLPGSKAEVEAIGKLLQRHGYKVDLATGVQVTETRFKELVSPEILHVATHGYFLEDAEVRKNNLFGATSESAQKNPLLKSGLLLSGAERVDEDHASMDENGDGVLTAYEATNLTLEGTKLVVLSACETAVGDVKAGEGVYGLQRAFLGAGADGLIMSLWKVDDKATQQLMLSFYKWLFTTNNLQKSFKSAQLELQGQYPDPYYWGAFVLIR